MMFRLCFFAALICLSAGAVADEVILNNGDRVTGDITRVDAEKITIEKTAFGTVTAARKDVKSYTTTQPATASSTTQAATTRATQPATTMAVAPPPPVPPVAAQPKRWSGSVVATGLITRGNANTETYKLNADAVRKGDNNIFTLAGGYAFGQQKSRDTGDTNATIDNWFGLTRFDHLFSERLYEYALLKVEGDRIADLDVRASPGVGVGYRWIISPETNFSTEIGLTWVYEQYSTDGSNENFAVRMAYHFDKKLNDKVSFVHNVEWLPNISDPSDYILNADAGLRALLTAAIFTELKVEWRRDSTPAPRAEKNDLRYTIGVGFKF
jgi:putative salt-induced outer membrane protein YdiY